MTLRVLLLVLGVGSAAWARDGDIAVTLGGTTKSVVVHCRGTWCSCEGTRPQCYETGCPLACDFADEPYFSVPNDPDPGRLFVGHMKLSPPPSTTTTIPASDGCCHDMEVCESPTNIYVDGTHVLRSKLCHQEHRCEAPPCSLPAEDTP